MVTVRQDRTLPATLVRLRQNVTATEYEGAVALIGPRGASQRMEHTPGLVAAIEVLATHGASESQLGAIFVHHDGPEALARLYHYLRIWGERALLRYTLVVGGAPLTEIEPMVAGPRLDLAPPANASPSPCFGDC